MNWRCIVFGHQWTAFRHWADDAPRIVRASLEYLNDTTHVRDCERCGKRQTAPDYRAALKQEAG